MGSLKQNRQYPRVEPLSGGLKSVAASTQPESHCDHQPLPYQEDLFSFALESASEGFWSFDTQTKQIAMSPRCHELTGIQSADFRGHFEQIVDRICNEDRQKLISIVAEALRTETSFEVSFRIRCTSSEQWRWLRCRGKRVRSGESEGLVGSLEDVTESHQMEVALKGSEERYQLLVENQGEGIAIVDNDENFIFVNPAAEKLFGVKKGGLVGKNIRNFVDPEQFERIVKQTNRRLEGSTDTYEVVITRQNGEKRTLLLTSSARYDESGNVTSSLGIFRDITERKKADIAVRESEERYRLLIDSLPHGVGVVARNRVRYVNQALVRMLGYDREEDLLKVPAIKHLVPGEEENFLEQLALLESGGSEGPVHCLARGLRTDGTEVPLEIFVTLVTYEGELAYQFFIIDMTERYEADQERAHLEEQLRQAHKMESIGRLAGGIAHDFNNMLAPILSLSQLMQVEDERQAGLSRDLQTIVEAAERARDLTQQLLAFGRKQLLKMVVLDLNQVVEKAHDLLRRFIRETIEIQLELDPEIGAVRADASQINQVLLNLTLNARDSIDNSGRITIRTSLANVDESAASRLIDIEAGPYVTLEVSDSGCGMDEETVDRVFEPFFSTKGHGQGTGLGLATVHGIVKQHGGNITVASSPGVGTTFTIFLPSVTATKTELKRPSWTEAGERLEGTILVVEDDGAVRRAACRILHQQGFNVLQARDGEEALVMMRRAETPVDVVLTDVIMPRMNGQELAQRLAVQYPEVAVVFMSGYTDDMIAHMGVLDEGTIFVQKPFSVRSLLEKVAQAFTIARPYRTRSSVPEPNVGSTQKASSGS